MYNPLNHYWVVDDSQTQVYSSKSFSYVNIADQDYVDWLALGFTPTALKSNFEGDFGGVYKLSTVINPILDELIKECEQKLIRPQTEKSLGITIPVGEPPKTPTQRLQEISAGIDALRGKRIEVPE